MRMVWGVLASLGDWSVNLRIVDVAAVQETYFICEKDVGVLGDDYVFFSAFGHRLSARVSLLVGRSLHADVNAVFSGEASCLVEADVAMRSFKFRVMAVYAPTHHSEWRSFRCLELFLMCSERLLLVGDWNATLNPKIDKVGRGASMSVGCESSLIDFMAMFDLVDRFRLDHPVEMWT